MRECQASETLPLLVHCSAGCGRTGTICAIDHVWTLMRTGVRVGMTAKVTRVRVVVSAGVTGVRYVVTAGVGDDAIAGRSGVRDIVNAKISGMSTHSGMRTLL